MLDRILNAWISDGIIDVLESMQYSFARKQRVHYDFESMISRRNIREHSKYDLHDHRDSLFHVRR